MYSKQGKEYLQKLCEMPCLFCNKDPGGQAHHIRSGLHAMGMKPEDKYAVPICQLCHYEIHAIRGEKIFFEKYGYTIDQVKDIALKLYEET